MTNLIQKLFGRKSIELAKQVTQPLQNDIKTEPEKIPDKLIANQDLVAFCHKYGIELSSGNNKGNSFKATLGKVAYTYDTGQQLRDFRITAARNERKFAEDIHFEDMRDSKKLSYDCRIDVEKRDCSSLPYVYKGFNCSYLFDEGKYLGMRGDFGACMGGSWFTQYGSEPLPSEFFEEAKAGIVVLEALVGRILIERPKIKGEIK